MNAPREWFDKDFYATLGVAKDASAKDITKAYRKLARQYHPDTNPGDQTAEDRFKEISAAYEVLGDDTKRAEYDEVRRLGPAGAGGFSFNVGGEGLNDILNQMFGGAAPPRGRRFRPHSGAGPRRGADMETQLTLSFQEAAQGVTTTLYLTSDGPCSTCSGSGAKPGTSPSTCPKCGGRGSVDDNQGFFSFSTPCTRCQGRGTIIEQPCATCKGAGNEKRQREVKVRLPVGVADGQRIRLKGRGGPGVNGGPAGDLFVECHVTPHPLFGRDDKNLLLKVPITFAEAAMGAEIDVPTLDGGRVTVRVPQGTASGAKLRVRGRGLELPSGQGDLIVTVEVAVPSSLNDDQRRAVEAFAAATTVSLRQHLFTS
jgi:molecular chaperone DnaJ